MNEWQIAAIQAITQKYPDADSVEEAHPVDANNPGIVVRNPKATGEHILERQAIVLRECLEATGGPKCISEPVGGKHVRLRPYVRLRSRFMDATNPGDAETNVEAIEQPAPPNTTAPSNPPITPTAAKNRICKNIILQGPSGTGKTHAAKALAVALSASNPADQPDVPAWITAGDLDEAMFTKLRNEKRVAIVQFHPTLAYEDFVRGLTLDTTAHTGNENTPIQPAYRLRDGIFMEMCNAARADRSRNYTLIIDEINRADIPSVFGELIYGIEYRDGEISTAHGPLSVPDNLYIIGTVNTADRGSGRMDYAIRRRFECFSMLPDPGKPNDNEARRTLLNVLRLFVEHPETSPIDWSAAAAATLSRDIHPSDVAPGHTSFIGSDWPRAFQRRILPLLVEYLKDGILHADGATGGNGHKAKEIEKIHYGFRNGNAMDAVNAFNRLFDTAKHPQDPKPQRHD